MKSSTSRANLRHMARTVASLACLLLLFVGSATAGTPTYVVSAGLTGNGVFGTVDLSTGFYRSVGPGEPDGYFGLGPGPNGTLVSLTYAGNLVSINPGTGVTTKIGPTGLAACVVPTDPSCGPTSAFSLGAFNGKIYSTDYANDIYVVDAQTGVATELSGNTGIPASPYVLGSQDTGKQFFGTEVCKTDFCLNFADEVIWQSGGKLYLTYDAWVFDTVTFSDVEDVVEPALYEIDPTTGLAAEIGPTAFAIGGVVDVNGTAYAFDDWTGQILKLDLTTGNYTPAGNFASAAGVIQGAAPLSGPSFIGRFGWLRLRRGGPERP